MDKEKYTTTTFCGLDKISKRINDPHFKDLEELNDNRFEVMEEKHKIIMDTPIQIGLSNIEETMEYIKNKHDGKYFEVYMLMLYCDEWKQIPLDEEDDFSKFTKWLGDGDTKAKTSDYRRRVERMSELPLRLLVRKLCRGLRPWLLLTSRLMRMRRLRRPSG
jgi:hypothetical protein